MRPNYFPTALQTLIAIATLLFGGNAYAANWYVRPSSAGSSTGADWNNAWSASSISWGSVKPGDTVWLAGGNYPSGFSIRASGSSGSPILIYRVLSTDSVPASAPGWQSSFDSPVTTSGGISFPNCSYVTLDGRVPYKATVGSLGVSNAGIVSTISLAGGNGINLAPSGDSVTSIIIRNVSIVGPYASVSNPSGGGGVSGINCGPATNCVFHGISIVGIGEAVRSYEWNGDIVEYCYIADTANDGQQHEDVQYSYPSTNCIWRYNTINNSPNDGLFFEFGGATNFYFYGNVYYNSQNWLICTKAASGSVYGPIYIYNNVFMNPDPNAAAWVSTNGATMTGHSYVYDNIFYNASNQFSGSSGVTSDYNAYNSGQPSGETHSFTFSANPFVSIPKYSQPVGTIGNFNLTAAAQASFANGIPITADGFINKDLNGNTRSNPWYIGAYQYLSSQQSPQPPTGLRITGS